MLMRLTVQTMLALAAVVTVGALAYAEETVIEQRTYEASHVDVAQPDQERVVIDVVPPAPVDERVVERPSERVVERPSERVVERPSERVIEERTVTQEHPVVEQRTDTVTTVHDDDDEGDDDDDGAVGDDEAY